MFTVTSGFPVIRLQGIVNLWFSIAETLSLSHPSPFKQSFVRESRDCDHSLRRYSAHVGYTWQSSGPRKGLPLLQTSRWPRGPRGASPDRSDEDWRKRWVQLLTPFKKHLWFPLASITIITLHKPRFIHCGYLTINNNWYMLNQFSPNFVVKK